jgi:NADPH:quinone reductase-like Zn-dependent oxidoreductase
LKKDGTLAHISNSGTDHARVQKGLNGEFPFKYTMTIVHPDGEQLALMTKYIEAGQIKVIIDRVLPLEKARCAQMLPSAAIRDKAAFCGLDHITLAYEKLTLWFSTVCQSRTYCCLL